MVTFQILLCWFGLQGGGGTFANQIFAGIDGSSNPNGNWKWWSKLCHTYKDIENADDNDGENESLDDDDNPYDDVDDDFLEMKSRWVGRCCQHTYPLLLLADSIAERTNLISLMCRW